MGEHLKKDLYKLAASHKSRQSMTLESLWTKAFSLEISEGQLMIMFIPSPMQDAVTYLPPPNTDRMHA